MLSVEKVAEFLGIGLPQVRNLVNAGSLSAVTEGGKQMIEPQSLLNLVSTNDKYAHLKDKVGDLGIDIPGVDMPDVDVNAPDVKGAVTGAADDVRGKAGAMASGATGRARDMAESTTARARSTTESVARQTRETAAAARPTATAQKRGGINPLVWLLPLILLGGLAFWALSGGLGGGGASSAGVPCSEADIEVNDLNGCTLRIAVENAYQPFNFIDTETGEAVGYDYDIFEEVCGRLNCETEFVETSWDAMVAIMGGQGEADTFDVGADGITITAERDQNVDFSIPYITSSQVLLVRLDEDRFTQPAEFAADSNLLIATQLGTTNYDAAVNLVGEDRIQAVDQFGAAVQALIIGDVDAVMIDNVAGQGYVGENADQLKITGEAVQSEELGFIFAEGSPLKQPIDVTLQVMEEDGKLQELFEKWFDSEG